MLGTSVTLETRYAWNGFRWGLGMRATRQNFQMRSLENSNTSGLIGPLDSQLYNASFPLVRFHRK